MIAFVSLSTAVLQSRVQLSRLVLHSARAPVLHRTRPPMLCVEECEPEGRYCVTASGVKFIDISVGDGEEATEGRVASIEYEGGLLDSSQVIASTREKGKPLSFRLGDGGAPLWEEAVMGMRVGGKRRVLVPPSNTLDRWEPLANNATARFECELTGLDVKGALDQNIKLDRRQITQLVLFASFVPYLLPNELRPALWRRRDTADPDPVPEDVFIGQVSAPLTPSQQREVRREERAIISDEVEMELYGRK